MSDERPGEQPANSPPQGNAATPTDSTQQHSVPAPLLEGERTRLRPMGPGDLPFVAALASTPENLWTWRQRGATYSQEAFAELVSSGALCQFVVQRRASGQPIGHVAAVAPDHRNGHAHLTVLYDGNARAGVGWRLEGLVLFVNYLFQTFPLRKLYAEVPEFNMARFASGAGRFFAEEGRLREHEFLAGTYWDLLIIAIHRRLFADLADGPLRKVLRSPTDRGPRL